MHTRLSLKIDFFDLKQKTVSLQVLFIDLRLKIKISTGRNNKNVIFS